MSPLPVLLVVARGHACALALADVIETFRPLPCRPVADLPRFVRGIAVVRGAPVPVLDLGLILGGALEVQPSRFVSVRAGGRTAVIAVDLVRGIARLAPVGSDALPAWHAARPGVVEAVGTVGDEVVVVVRAAALLADELWRPETRA